MAIQKIEEMIASNAEVNNQRQSGGGVIPATMPNSAAGPVHGSITTGTRAPLVGNVPPALMSRNIQLPPPILEQTSGKFVGLVFLCGH